CAGVDRDLLEDLFGADGHGHQGGGHGGHGGGHGGGGGGPIANDCGGFISSDAVLVSVARDLQSLDREDQAFARYVTLANEANANGCGAALNVSRAALNKLVNSLSTETTVEVPVAVDANETLYRLDLRDFGWDRSIDVDGTVFVDGWEAIIASSPYAIPFEGDDADDAAADSGTSVPVLFGNALVAAATNGPLYYGLLGISDNIDAFVIDDLGVDVAADRQNAEVVRAGLGGTGVGRFEFLAERHDIEFRQGVLWQIFSDENGAEALIDDPLSTPSSEEREITFTLPNGFLAHALAAADGQRLNESALTLDTNENDFVARIARSYINFRAQGVNVTDEIRAFALANPDRFEPEELDQILAIYPADSELRAILDDDTQAFVESALARANVDFDAPDPIHASFVAFDADVDADTAAADLYVSKDDLLNSLNLLDPAMGVLDGGRMDRGDFEFFYLDSLCILGVVNNNTVASASCD
ncbi:MAG TPA: hypothetical protein VMG12_02420, partial [Polyangiaceae bacterium]|nr:hypothetical protein [Polyangiaceae bacterium]